MRCVLVSVTAAMIAVVIAITVVPYNVWWSQYHYRYTGGMNWIELTKYAMKYHPYYGTHPAVWTIKLTGDEDTAYLAYVWFFCLLIDLVISVCFFYVDDAGKWQTWWQSCERMKLANS